MARNPKRKAGLLILAGSPAPRIVGNTLCFREAFRFTAGSFQSRKHY